MAKLDQFLDALSVAGTVTGYTGSSQEGAKAAGYSAWVQNVTGQTPYIRALANQRAEIVLTQTQQKAMRKFFDSQVRGILEKGDPPTVEYGLGEVLKPWALRYALPVGIIIFLVGMTSGKVFFNR